jgi:hypothetical protein
MRRRLFAVALTTLAVGCAASPALAHQGNINYRSELDGVVPAEPGLDVQVVNYDDSLQLENNTGKTVIVDGYQGEPYIRIAADGTVELNRNSPAYFLNDDRYGNAPVPDSADPDAEPDWELVDMTGQYVWHDHRIHYMSTATPSQVTDTDQRTKIFDYKVPIEVGGQPAAITGTLYWVGEAGGLPILPFVILGGLTLIGVALVIRRRRGATRPDESQTETAPAKEAW